MQLNEIAYTGVASEPAARDKQSLLAATRDEMQRLMREDDYHRTYIRTLWTVIFGLLAIVIALMTALYNAQH